MNVVVDALMNKVRTLSGPVAPSSLRARLWVHGEPARGFLLVMAVRPVPGSSTWEGIRVTAARTGEEACIDRETLSDLAVVPPRWGRTTKSSVCVLLPSD